MPSAEETTYLIELMPDSHRHHGFTSRDVDVLVSRIKENLRLSGFKSRSSLATGNKQMRPTPYRLPSRSWAEPSTGNNNTTSGNNNNNTCDSCSSDPEHPQRGKVHRQQQQFRRCRHCRDRKTPLVLEDSYERFQALLRNGALIKEAVKRLQTSPEDEDEEEAVGKGSRRAATSTSATSTTLDSMDDEEEEDENVARRRRKQQMQDESDDDFFYRRKRFYYDSEDEPLPPVYQPLDL